MQPAHSYQEGHITELEKALIDAIRYIHQLRDSLDLDRLLDRFQFLRKQPDFLTLRSDCDKYLQFLQYREAVKVGQITLSAVAKVVGANSALTFKSLYPTRSL